MNIIQWSILSLHKIVRGMGCLVSGFSGSLFLPSQKKRKKGFSFHFYLEPHTHYFSLDYDFILFFKLCFVVVNLPLMITRLFPLTVLVLWKYQQAPSFLFVADFFSAVFIHLLKITAQTTLKLSQLFLCCKILQEGAKILCLIWSILRILSILAEVLSLCCKLLSQKM